MKDITREEVEERRKHLPDDLKTALASVDLMHELQKIVMEQKLHFDEAGDVGDLVELTLSGVVPTRKFLDSLSLILPGKKRDEVLRLAEAINNRIFSKVRESLRAIDRENIEREGAVETPVDRKVSPTNVASVHEEKLSSATRAATTTRDISYENRDPRVKMIPIDVKQRINSDPYKEPIE